MTIRLLAATPEPKQHIELCSRICSESIARTTDDTYINMLIALLKNGDH